MISKTKILVNLLCTSLLIISCNAFAKHKDPVDYVNVFVGTSN